MSDLLKRVLIVEDEPLIALELETLVEEAGCLVVGPVATCHAGYAILQDTRVDAAIVDYMLRDESCELVADELIERKIPWALSTGVDHDTVPHRFHAIPVVSKPFSEGEVRRTLRELLGQADVEDR